MRGLPVVVILACSLVANAQPAPGDDVTIAISGVVDDGVEKTYYVARSRESFTELEKLFAAKDLIGVVKLSMGKQALYFKKDKVSGRVIEASEKEGWVRVRLKDRAENGGIADDAYCRLKDVRASEKK
jgi:hypothetical protein